MERLRRCALPVLALLVAVAVWPPPEEQLPGVAVQPSRPANEPDAIAALQDADTYLLAQLATAEDPPAAAAVTWVVLNRAGCRVAPLRCRVPVLRTVTHGHAFGTVLRGHWRPSWRLGGPVDARVLEKVRAVLQGRVPDPTAGARFFHRKGSWTPPWAPDPKKWRLLGSHFFYQEGR